MDDILVQLICVLLMFIMVFILLPLYLVQVIFIRPRQMEKIAKKYGLKYTKQEGSSLLILHNNRKNIIEGKINGNEVLVYDFTKTENFRRASLSTRSTEVNVNGVANKLGFFSLTGFGSVKEIDELLSGLATKA